MPVEEPSTASIAVMPPLTLIVAYAANIQQAFACDEREHQINRRYFSIGRVL